MKKLLLLQLFLILATVTEAQIIGPLVSSEIRQNGVSSVAATGDTLWIGPALNRNISNSPEWFIPTGIDSIETGSGRVFSLDVKQDTIFAGLGITSETLAGDQPAGYGYYLSTDGGDDWRFIDFPLDRFVDEDTTFVYGGVTYTRKRIIVPEQSPPYDVAFNENVLLSTNWASGLLRSTDLGESWERVVLPPFGVDELTPDGEYTWQSCVQRDGSQCVEFANIYNSVPDDNLKGFSVLIDTQKRVWFGSAGGINISDNALSAPLDSISWRNVNFSNDPNGLLARWIVEIKEDTSTGRIWMTNWIAEGDGSPFRGLDHQGLVYTEDGGLTFKQRLIGEKVNAITFKDGVVFAAAEGGLFISRDNGDTWIKSSQIKSANAILKSDASFRAAATTTNRVWIGTTDGVISTDDLGFTWEINRVNFPLSGGNPYDPDAKSVNTYAYPNPYSPEQHEIVRIRFDADATGSVNVKIFDFGMNLVRELNDINITSSGGYEALWDGLDGRGRRVANAPYFYVVEKPGGTVNGKILLIE